MILHQLCFRVLLLSGFRCDFFPMLGAGYQWLPKGGIPLGDLVGIALEFGLWCLFRMCFFCFCIFLCYGLVLDNCNNLFVGLGPGVVCMVPSIDFCLLVWLDPQLWIIVGVGVGGFFQIHYINIDQFHTLCMWRKGWNVCWGSFFSGH